MKILDTADWHVRKALEGRSRHTEHESAFSTLWWGSPSRRMSM